MSMKKNSFAPKGKGCLYYGVMLLVVYPLLAFALFGMMLVLIAALYTAKWYAFIGLVAIGAISFGVWKFFKKKSSQKYLYTIDLKPDETEPKSTAEASKSILGENYLSVLKIQQAGREEADAHYKLAVIDFETTGLSAEDDEILQVSIIDENENILIDQYCKPRRKTTWYSAANVNGIYPPNVENCPHFDQVADFVRDILSRADEVIAYNDAFEKKFLKNNGIDPDALTWGPDPMKGMTDFYNATRHGSRNRVSLLWAASTVGYSYNAHNAAEDVKATLYVYNFLKSAPKVEPPNPELEEPTPKKRSGGPRYKPNPNASPLHPLFGKTIVITGELPIDREEASQKAAYLGAKVRLKVSGKTDIVVCGKRDEELFQEKGLPSKKIRDAQQLNADGGHIVFMQGDEFMELLARPAGVSTVDT